MKDRKTNLLFHIFINIMFYVLAILLNYIVSFSKWYIRIANKINTKLTLSLVFFLFFLTGVGKNETGRESNSLDESSGSQPSKRLRFLKNSRLILSFHWKIYNVCRQWCQVQFVLSSFNFSMVTGKSLNFRKVQLIYLNFIIYKYPSFIF